VTHNCIVISKADNTINEALTIIIHDFMSLRIRAKGVEMLIIHYSRTNLHSGRTIICLTLTDHILLTS